MPIGYRVDLIDGSLDPGDFIYEPRLTFTTDTVIGAGEWTWSGTIGLPPPVVVTDYLESGVYYLATDGFVYFVPDAFVLRSVTTATVTTAPAFGSDGIVSGTSGNDLIDATYVDSDGDVIDGGDGTGPSGDEDVVIAGDGDDVVFSGAEDDTIYGGAGDDYLDGGADSDTFVFEDGFWVRHRRWW